MGKQISERSSRRSWKKRMFFVLVLIFRCFCSSTIPVIRAEQFLFPLFIRAAYRFERSEVGKQITHGQPRTVWKSSIGNAAICSRTRTSSGSVCSSCSISDLRCVVVAAPADFCSPASL